MSIFEVVVLAIGLSMDALAVSIATAIALTRVDKGQLLRMSGAFGFFQALMPILGWLGGAFLVQYIARFDHWIAFGLLAVIGTKMFFEKEEEETPDKIKDNTRGLSLLILAIATSIDALAVGFSMAMVETDGGLSIWVSALLIGCITMAISAVGMIFGARLGSRLQKVAGKIGGAVLVAIGLKILLEHLLGA